MRKNALNKPNSKAATRAEAERRILDAAEETFALAGFRGASMQQIADRAEMPKANLHYYFSNKETLYRMVLSRILTIWLEAANAFSSDDNPQDALRAYIHAKMEISRKHPAGSRIWAGEILRGAPIIQTFLKGELRDWMEERETAIRRWIDAGLIQPIEPKNLVFMIWAITQHYADFEHQIYALNDAQPMSDAQWAKATEDATLVILRGLGCV